MALNLLIKNIDDQYIVENFVRIKSFTDGEVFLSGNFKFFTVTLTSAVTNFRFKHNLEYIPKDIILTSKTGAGTVTFNYDLFSATYIDITTSAATTLRFIAGSM